MTHRILRLALVTALVMAAVPLAGCHSIGVGALGGQKKNVEVVIVFHAAVPEVVKLFRQGDTVKTKDTGSIIGQITAIQTTDTLEPTPNAAGDLVAAPVPGQSDVILTIHGTPMLTEDAYRFSGERVFANQELKLITPLVSFPGTVLSIRETGQ